MFCFAHIVPPINSFLLLAVFFIQMTSTRKAKIPDPSRSNTLPRFLTEDDIPSTEKSAKKFLSSSLNKVDRDEIKHLLKSQDNPSATLKRIEEKKLAELEKRKKHENEIYTLDLSPIENTFGLPGKPISRTTLPPEFAKRTQHRRAQKHSSLSSEKSVAQEAVSPSAKHFLPDLLGLDDVTPPAQQAASMLPSSGDGNRPLSDLDQISAIMSGIHTGNEAINFFARYGSDTPVSHAYY
jgi:hypothetical protein